MNPSTPHTCETNYTKEENETTSKKKRCCRKRNEKNATT
jgi:hypothetical protein